MGICWESSICSNFDNLELDGICHLSFELGRIHLHRVIWSGKFFVGVDFEREILAVPLFLWGIMDKLCN